MPSTTERILMTHFAERHAQNERIALIEVQVSASQQRGEVGLIFRVRREANDLPSWLSPYGGGKAAIDCASGVPAIFVWSMGQNDEPWPSPCPRPPASSLGDPIVACSSGPNAKSRTAEFRIVPTGARLPARCRPSRVARTLVRALTYFNVGLGEDYARRFVARGELRPYAQGRRLRGRSTIARFVSTRYHAGDGWAAARLLPPRTGSHAEAVYRLDLIVSYQGRVTARARSTIVVDCGSGLLRQWTGPLIRTPGS